MGENSAIAWTHHTFNPWEGCVNVSAECDNCYAEVRDERWHGGENWGKDSSRLFHIASYWNYLRKWNREAETAGERRRVFEGSLCDVMEDRDDLSPLRLRLFAEIEQTPWLDHLLLTKRPQNFRRFLPAAWINKPLQNVWLGTTVGVGKSLWRADALRETPAATRFLSMEPLLEMVLDLPSHLTGIDWVILGGESGDKARPCATEWIRHGIRQCRKFGIAPFVKQLGSVPMMDESSWHAIANAGPAPLLRASKATYMPAGFVPLALNDRKGGDWMEWPDDLRVREFPVVAR